MTGKEKPPSSSTNNMQQLLEGMIFAAGMGTRFKPWTDEHPKALAPVNGKSLLQRNVEFLQQYGIFDVIVNVHHFAEQVIEAIANNKGWGSRIRISHEKEELLETGGGLKYAGPLFSKNNIVLINVDILTDLNLQQMIEFHFRQQPLATLAVSNRQTSRYFLFDQNNLLCGWRNVKTGEEIIRRPASNLIAKAFSGIHIVNKKLISLISKPGKIGIVDVYMELAGTHTIMAFDHSGSKFIDVGRPASLVEAESIFT